MVIVMTEVEFIERGERRSGEVEDGRKAGEMG